MKRGTSRIRPAAAGFSLIELIVVLAILALLAALVTPRVMGALGKAKVQTTLVQIEQISAALDLFLIDNGRYPSEAEGLGSLLSRPDGLETWNGPYLSKDKLPADGWSRPFAYATSETDGGGTYFLFSLGADGRPGGEGAGTDLGRMPDAGS